MKRCLNVLAVVPLLLLTATAAPVASAAPPASSGGGSTCTLPATDLCTDFLFRGYRWAPKPIPYWINPAGAPDGAISDVQDAFLTWENEVKSAQVEAAYPGDRSTVSFLYMGTTGSTGAKDGKNVVYFTGCSQCGPAWVKNKVLNKKTITEFDIEFNSSVRWTTDITCPSHDCGALDVQNVATHEIGHVLDLYHVDTAAASQLTMHSGASPDELLKRDLGAGDIRGLRAAYPMP